MTTINEGTRFFADVPIAAWYQPATDIGAALNDETVMFGGDFMQVAASVPSQITDLSLVDSQTFSADLSWSEPMNQGAFITDYLIYYNEEGTPTWNLFADGVTTNTEATVTSLNASTSYNFGVIAVNTVGNSITSNTVSDITDPDSIFSSGAYIAYNLGGAVDSQIVAFEDSTTVTLNGVFLVTLNKGGTHQFTSAQNDVIESDKPTFVAGSVGNGNESKVANVVWHIGRYADNQFALNSYQSNPQLLTLFTLEPTFIELKQDTTVLDSVTLAAEAFHTFQWNGFASFQLESTGNIICFTYTNPGGSRYIDARSILPSATDVIGFPSETSRFSTLVDSTNYTYTHSDSTSGSGTRFVSTTRFAAWHQPSTTTAAGNDDETILYGFD